MTISEMVKAAHDNAKDKGFWEGDSHNIPEKLALIHSEVSEALEELRENSHHESTIDQNGKPGGFEYELADIVIRVADLAGFLGIPLEKVVTTKMAYNKSRPFKHGKRF